MASVDERIVRMIFDNSKFESGVKTTINTLANLKEKLKMNDAANSFSKISDAAKNVSFGNMANDVESISNRFSTMGIIGMTVLQNLTNAAVNAGKTMVSNLVNPLIQGGKTRALNLEQAQFQIEGLGQSWAEVKEDVLYGVKDTAYGLDVAAKAAGQLLASNVEVGDSMKTALRGISGVAAMTGAEYEDISNVFTTVAGNGRLMANELNRLSARGINAAATLGKYLGKSEAEVRQMTSKGQIDFATFAAAMDDAFGAHAKEANKTFTGSLSNMKAALSRIGADFFTPYFQNMRDVFNALTPVIDDVHEALTPVLKSAEEGMSVISQFVVKTLNSLDLKTTLAEPLEKTNVIFRNLGSTVANFGNIVLSIFGPIARAFANVFGTSLLDIIIRFTEAIKNFTHQLIFTERMSTNLQKTFEGIFTILKVMITIISRVIGLIAGPLLNILGKAFSFILDIFLKITGVFGELITKAYRFIEALIKLQTVQRIIVAIKNAIALVKSWFELAYLAVQKFIQALMDKTFDAAFYVLKKIASVLKLIFYTLDDVISKFREFLIYIYELPQVQAVLNRIKETFNDLKKKIVDVAQNVKSKLGPAFEKVKDIFSKVIDKVRELIQKYVQLPPAQEMIARLQEFVANIFENSAKVFEKVKEVVQKVIERAKELGEVSLSKIIDNFEKLRSKIAEVVDQADVLGKLKKAFEFVKDGIQGAFVATGGMLEGIKKGISDFISWIQDKFANISLGDVIAAGAGASLIAFFLSLTNFVNKAAKLTKSITGIAGAVKEVIEGINGVFKSVQDFVKAKTTEIKMAAISNAISSIIKSIALLAAALALLSTMDPERLKTSAITLGLLAGAIIALSAVVTRLQKDIDPKAVAASTAGLLAVSGSLLILVAAFKLLSTVDLDGIAIKLIAMGVLMAEFAGLSVILSKYAKEMPATSASMIAISLSVLLLARALNTLGKISMQNIVSSIATLTALMGFMAVLGAISSKADWKSALSILAMVIALRLIIGAIKALAKIDASTAQAGIIRLIQVMGAFSLLLIATSVAGANAHKAAATILAVSVAMNLIAIAIKNMAGIDDSQIDTASKIVTKIMGLFALITALSLLAGKNSAKAGVLLLSVAGSMLLLTAAIAVLGKLNEEEVERASAIVVRIMAMFALIIAATTHARDASKTIKYIAITLGALAAALAILSLIDPSNIKAASLALTMLMGSFALIVASTGLIKESKVTIALMMAVVAELALILAALAQLPVESVLGTAKSLSAVMLSLAATAAILQVVNPQAAAMGVAGFTIVVAGIGLIMAALSALNEQIPEVSEFLRKGIPILQAIGEGIGAFLGGLAGGFVGAYIGSASSGLVTLAENLSKFMEGIQPFLNGAANIDDRAISGVQNLVSTMVLLAASDFMNGLNAFFGSSGSSIRNLSENLPLFAQAMNDFAANIDESQLSKIKEVIPAAKSLAEISNLIPREGGIFQMFTGSSGLEGFSQNLEGFGKGLTAYGKAVSGLNTTAITASIEPAKSLIEIANSINADQGLLQVFAGSQYNAMVGLIDNLESFGKALTAYGKAVSNVNNQAIKNSIDSAKGVVEIANSINGEGGIAQLFGGSSIEGMKGLSENLKAFGRALKAYGDEVNGLNTGAIETSIGSAQSIINLLKTLNAEGGIINWFAGSTDIATKGFIDNLVNLGKALRSFGDETAQMNTSGISVAISVANSIVAIASKIRPDGGAFGWIFGDGAAQTLSKFNSAIIGLGIGLKAFASEVSNLDTSGTGAAIQVANGLVQISKKLDPEGGALGLIFGSKSEALGNMSQNLKLLGKGIYDFASQVQGMSTGGIDIAIKAADGLVQVAEKLDPEGGVASWIFGTQSQALESFSANLEGLGRGLAAFGEKVKGSSADEMIKAADGLNAIAQAVKDSNELSSAALVGNRLKEFGEKFAEYSNKMNEVSTDAIEKAVTYLEKLTQVSSAFEGIDLSNLQVLVDLTKDSEKLSSFGHSLEEFGACYQSFANKMSEISVESLQQATEWLGQLTEQMSGMANIDTSGLEALATVLDNSENFAYFPFIGKNLEEFGACFQSFANKMSEVQFDPVNTAVDAFVRIRDEVQDTTGSLANLSNVGHYVEEFGACLLSFSYKCSEINFDAIYRAVDAYQHVQSSVTDFASIDTSGLESLISLLEIAGTNAVQAFVDALNNGAAYASTAISNTCNSVVNTATSTLQNAYPRFTNIGQQFMNNLKGGMDRGKSAITNSISQLVNEVINKLNELKDKAAQIGKSMMEGLAQGIEQNKSLAINAASKAAAESYEAAKRAIDSHSPSKKFIELGKFACQGLAIGLEKYSHLSSDAASDTAKDAVESTSRVLAQLANEAIDDGLNYEPVITPVIDGSQIEAGLKSIDDRISGSSNLYLGDAARQLGYSINNMRVARATFDANQNGSGSTVINNYDMTQNNYSPKALSKIDIYRNTKNQFSRLKQLGGGA